MNLIPTIARKMSSFFIRYSVINKEDSELYDYCFEVLISTVINFLFIITASVILGTVYKTCFYLLGFIPLRRYAGGYHAKTHFRCFLTLAGSYSLFLAVLAIIPSSAITYIIPIIQLFSFLAIWFWAPVGNKNNPISIKSKSIFQHKSRVAIFTDCFILLIVMYFSKVYALCFSLGILTSALSLVVWRKHK